MILAELADRCEQATGPDRELDCRIHYALTDQRDSFEQWFEGLSKSYEVPEYYTAFLDAAMTLVPPADKWPWNVTMATAYGSASVIPNHGGSYGVNDPFAGHCRGAATPALALCAAALRARSS